MVYCRLAAAAGLIALLAMSTVMCAEPLKKDLEELSGLLTHLPFPTAVETTSDRAPSYVLEGASVKDVDELLKVKKEKDGILKVSLLDQKKNVDGNVTGLLRVPAGSLRYLKSQGAGKVCVKGNATATDAFQASNKGSGDVAVVDATFNTLFAKVAGGGRLMVSSTSLKAIECESTGGGDAVFTGVAGTVDLKLKGKGNVNVTGNGSSTIKGEAKGPGRVFYTEGNCIVSAKKSDDNVCNKIDATAMSKVGC